MAYRARTIGLAKPARTGRRLRFEPLEDRQLLAAATLTPVADTYTRAGVGAGSSAVLDVLDRSGGDYIAYIRFDLSGLNIDQITAATLSLGKVAGTRNDTIVTDRFDNYGLTNSAGNTPQNWNEATLADGNLGAEYTGTSGNGVDTTRLFNLNSERDANVVETVNNSSNPQQLSGPDLVSFLNTRVADGGLATFISLVDAGQLRGWGYASRENATESLRPTLQITYDEGDPDPPPALAPRQMEYLDRGILVVRRSMTQAYVGWRLLASDPAGIAFNLYRSAGGGTPVKLNATPITQTTDFVDTTADFSVSNRYFVRPVIGGVELAASGSFTLAANAPLRQYLNVPLQRPAGGTVTVPAGTQTPPSGTLGYTYDANDASIGDLDGDGQYEIVLKWEPTNAQDNANEGLTGPVIIDAYKLDGTLLWRINLGRNIRAGAHYTQFLVYDFDGDGRAELVMKTADGTVDGVGNVIGNPNADYRDGYTGTGDSRWGRVLAGPEFLTVFNGMTGAAMITVPFSPERGSVSSWGDTYGNRVDRFLATVAYLDGERPSIVMARGYYAKTRLTAYDWRDGQLTQRWAFDSTTSGNGAYGGQGNHNLSVADVDNDGKDEIIYGAMVVDDNGAGLYSTGWGHGDALHVSDMLPWRPGLEVFQPHESPSSYGTNGATVRDALTGELIFGIPANNDVGRGVAADIDPNSPGYEMWATTSDPSGGPRYIYGANGTPLYQAPSNTFYNFVVWWDADLTRELLDGTTISEWNNPGRSNFDLDPGATGTQQFAPNASSNNGSKSTPALSADIFGDWREEVIWRRSDNTALLIFTTIIPATNRFVTLMHDAMYREAIAWQNVAYNQPPHPSFFLGAGMSLPATPNVYTVQYNPVLTGDYNGDDQVDAADYVVWRKSLGQSGSNLPADGDRNGSIGPGDYDIWVTNFGAVGPPAPILTYAGGPPASTLPLSAPGASVEMLSASSAETLDATFATFADPLVSDDSASLERRATRTRYAAATQLQPAADASLLLTGLTPSSPAVHRALESLLSTSDPDSSGLNGDQTDRGAVCSLREPVSLGVRLVRPTRPALL